MLHSFPTLRAYRYKGVTYRIVYMPSKDQFMWRVWKITPVSGYCKTMRAARSFAEQEIDRNGYVHQTQKTS